MAEPRLAYALARLAARHAALGRAGARATLSASRGADRYLDVLRQTRLLTPPERVTARDLDAFELYLVGVWRAACEEVASWHPPRWRAAYRWCAYLADLPVLDSLRGPAPASGWALNDPLLAPLAAAPPAERPAALAAAGLGALAPAFAAGGSLAAAWRERWHQLWPRPPPATLLRLGALEALCLAAAGEDLAGGERRARLAERLERLYRRSRGTAAAGFCELGRRALDLETWRGGFASRLYAPAAASGGAPP